MRSLSKILRSSAGGVLFLASPAGVVLLAGPLVAPAPAKAAESNLIRISNYGPGVAKRVKLGLNKAVVIDLPQDAHDILVADPSLADAVTRSSRRIYLFGKTVGQTNIFIFGADGGQIVSIELNIERDISGLEEQLARFIPDSDIDVEIISDNIVLTGTVRTPIDSARAAQLAEIFLTGGEATTRNITATGGANGGDAAIFAEERQKSQIVNLLTIEGEDQVTLKVTVAEVSRQVLKQLGFNHALSGNGQIDTLFLNNNPANLGKPLANNNGLRLAGQVANTSFQSYMHAMEQAGVMRTLAEPTLTAISGESASFSVGGEFKVVQNQNVESDTNSIVYEFEDVEYGVELNFTPVVLSPGRISLAIDTKVSEPTFEGSVSLAGAGTLPGMTGLGIKRRQASTSVELPSGGSIMIAGLMQDNVRQAISGFPGLSKVPVLGTLFRSRDFIRNETELVIIATPYLVRPVARNALARPDDNFNPAADGAGFFLGRVNRIYGQMDTKLPDGRYHGVVGFIYK